LVIALLQSVLGRLTRVTRDSHRPPRSGCAINAAIEVLGDPWSMLGLRDVIFGIRRQTLPEHRIVPGVCP
jgi:hypothetical protein